MSNKYNPSEALGFAKNYKDMLDSEGIARLSTGHFAKISAVSASLIEAAQSSIEMPDPPLWTNPKTGKDEPNELDPKWQKQLEDWELQRTLAAMDVIIMFGVDLVNEDGTPYHIDTSGKWLDKLVFLSRRGVISLEDFDVGDDMTLEYIYKKYVAVGTPDIQMVASASSLNEKEVEKATATFQDNTA